MEGGFPARAEKAEIERTIKKFFPIIHFSVCAFKQLLRKARCLLPQYPIQVIHIPMHTAVIIPTDRQFLKHDLFRQKTVTIIAAAKWDTSPFVILDAFVKHQQLKLPVLEQPARTDTVQPEIGHQQGERLVQLQAAFKNVHFSAERRIRYNNIPTIRLVSKKILSGTYMRVFYLKSGFLQMKHELAVARIKRAPYDLPLRQILDDGSHSVSRSVFLVTAVQEHPAQFTGHGLLLPFSPPRHSCY